MQFVSSGEQKSPPAIYRVMLCGQEDFGQEGVLRALLRLFEGCSLQLINLPTLMMTEQGNACAGLVKLVKEAVQRQDFVLA